MLLIFETILDTLLKRLEIHYHMVNAVGGYFIYYRYISIP